MECEPSYVEKHPILLESVPYQAVPDIYQMHSKAVPYKSSMTDLQEGTQNQTPEQHTARIGNGLQDQT